MKIVIDIQEEEYNTARFMGFIHKDIIFEAIKNSTPLPKGKWIPILEKDGTQAMEETYGKVYKCSVCGFTSYGDNFCPNCGAKMEVE